MNSSPSKRRVLSRDEAIAIGRKLLDMVGAPYIGVGITHTTRALTKVANGNVLRMIDTDDVWVRFQSQFGTGLGLTIDTNQLDEALFSRIVKRAKDMAPPYAAFDAPDDPDGAGHFIWNPRPLMPVNLWHDSSADAMDTARGTVVPELIERLRASRLVGAATVGQMARSVLHIYPLGLTSFGEETDCEVTVTARWPDYKGAGWNGQAHRDWSKINTSAVADRAIEITKRSHNPVALEPGRRTAILSPEAVAEMMYCMAGLFSAERTNVAGPGTPFTYVTHTGAGKHVRLGERVVDARIMMRSDPADPDGGFLPFFEEGGREAGLPGFPTQAVTWINHGVLEELSRGITDGVSRRLPISENPYSIRVAPVPGTKTATIDEMIANCKEGVYVNRLSGLLLLDPPSAMMTGNTRDGCFLIKDGKIAKPITNFRFTDSPIFAMNKLEMIGEAVRVSFGNVAPLEHSTIRRGWPRLPVIAPPMMVQDFNFSGTANAV